MSKCRANRYFIKADKHGVGAAYYLPVVRANGCNIKRGGSIMSPRSGAILHEIGHGYQGVFMGQAIDLPVGEVWVAFTPRFPP
ncbi:hypothetical protein KCP71_00550 [Salmonella enterica subsp. enterica]|nr:hypothetical protein KCP71_00550 [Salmonella enterica subsp. enterica]